jgi:hypothetical protein
MSDNIQKDIVDLYSSLMKEQKRMDWNSLCSGGNMWLIISSYIFCKYWKDIWDEVKDFLKKSNS